jgi:hypothetical protein
MFSAVLLIASIALAGCAGEDSGEYPAPTRHPDPESRQGFGSDDAAPPRPTEQLETTASLPGKRRSVVIGWLKKYTPTGGGGTVVGTAYVQFMQGDCASTLELAQGVGGMEGDERMEEPFRSVYEGAAAACLAAFHGRPALWKTAEARLASAHTGELSCWHLEVHAMLAELVRAHRDDPDAAFVSGKAAGSSSCPELTGLHPDHGPRAGGYTVEVTGRNLPATLGLYWFEHELVITAEKGDDGVMRVEVPKAIGKQNADETIKIDEAPRIDMVYASFTYDGCPDAKC